MKNFKKMFLYQLLVCGTLAFLISLALFYFMASLISQEVDLSAKSDTGGLVEFIQAKPKSTLKARKRTLPKKPEKEKKIAKMQLTSSPLSYAKSDLQLGLQGFSDILKEGMGEGVFTQSLTPLVRIEPVYPVQALLQRIEGYVRLSFDISPNGSTMNVRVVDSQPPRIFDQNSVRAVRKWKYNPQTENGKPVTKRGEEIELEFKLDKEGGG